MFLTVQLNSQKKSVGDKNGLLVENAQGKISFSIWTQASLLQRATFDQNTDSLSREESLH